MDIFNRKLRKVSINNFDLRVRLERSSTLRRRTGRTIFVATSETENKSLLVWNLSNQRCMSRICTVPVERADLDFLLVCLLRWSFWSHFDQIWKRSSWRAGNQSSQRFPTVSGTQKLVGNSGSRECWGDVVWSVMRSWRGEECCIVLCGVEHKQASCPWLQDLASLHRARYLRFAYTEVRINKRLCRGPCKTREMKPDKLKFSAH